MTCGAPRKAFRVYFFFALLIVSACETPEREQDATARLLSAWQAFRLADYDKALVLFDEIQRYSSVSPELKRQALYGQAIVHDLRQPVPAQNDQRATVLYREIIASAPGSEEAAWSMLALARMEHLVPVGEEPDYGRVRQTYQQVIDACPDHPAGHEALIYQQSTQIMTLEEIPTRQAIARLQKFMIDYPDSAFRSAAYDLLAQAHESLGEHDLQLGARIHELASLEVDPDSPASSDLSWRYWQIATTAEFLCGRFDVARDYYQRLIAEYPLDFRKFPAKQALDRMRRIEEQLMVSRAK